MDRLKYWTALGKWSLLLILSAAGSARAQAYNAEKVSISPPTELGVAVRETLGSEAVRVSGPQGALCEIWLRKVLPARAQPTQALGVGYGQLAEGTLVGGVRFLTDTTDYRSQRVKTGVYTMRYGLHPTDGNHMGISSLRDFLLLVPAAEDPAPGAVAREELMKLSRKATGSGHPAVWSLAAAEEGGAGNSPSVTHDEEHDLWVVHFRVQMQPEGGAVSRLVMALVVVGRAPEA